MREFIKDNRGQTIVEAVIYFPFIVILVMGMVVVGMFKLDKMLTQACMSERTTLIQSSLDSPYKQERVQYWNNMLVEDNLEYYSDNSIFKWVNPMEKRYIYVITENISPILQVSYSTANPNGGLFGLIGTKRTCSALLIDNPFDVVYTMDDLRGFYDMTEYGSVVQGKTGYTYEEYMDMQFGEHRR